MPKHCASFEEWSKKKKPRSTSASTTSKGALTKLNSIVAWSKKNSLLAGSAALVLVLAIVELVLIFGSSAQGLADQYKSSVNSASASSLDNPSLFPLEGDAAGLPDFLASSFTPFTVSEVIATVDEAGDSATLAVHTKEGATYDLAASKHAGWMGPFYSVRWQIDSLAPTIRVAPDAGLQPELKFTFADLPYTVTEISALASTGESYATLPGILRYTEPAFAFLQGGEQVLTYTSGSNVLTLGPTNTDLGADLIAGSQKSLKKTVTKCSHKSHCKSLPKYKNQEFKVKTPAGSWDHLSTADSYKLKACDIIETSYVSAIEARVNFTCPSKVTRHFVWSDTYQRGFFFWFWYFSWTETSYKSDQKSLPLTIDGEVAVLFDSTREKFTEKTMQFEGTKN